MLTCSKHCWSQHSTTILIFFNEFEINWVGKCLRLSQLKSSDCLLTRWLPMTSIPVDICRFSDNNFKDLYLEKEWLFFDFLLHSEMCMKFRTFWKKRRVSYPNIYRNYCNRKRCLLKRQKGLASAHQSVINVLTGSKHCWSQHGTSIFLFFNEFELNWVAKYYRRYIQIFWQQLQTLLSPEQNPFSQFLIAFLKCSWNLEHSQKKEEYPTLIITEIIASERDVYLSA